jgi:hypothetical protein
MGASTDLKRGKEGAVQRRLHFALEMDDCKLFRKRNQNKRIKDESAKLGR